ncbi:DUF883 domain-containing protein [Massilia sp. METH4]|uniref:DUF883 family protein n=1 Tax=Massilia sp. METH4 TaxID=3123041 RepID=UPI0030D0F3E5
MDQTTSNPTATGTVGNGKTGSDSGEARERLMGDLKNAINDAEQWLRGAANASSEDLGEAKTRFQETLRTAKTNLLTLEDSAVAKGKLAAQYADTYVHDNPWRSVVIGAVVGLLAGVIISRD